MSRRHRPGRAIGATVLLLLTSAACTTEPPEVPVASAPSGALWVSNQGDDDNPGTADRPWRTTAHAVAEAPQGATILLRKGTYLPFTVTRPGLTIASAPGEHATIKGRDKERDVVLITADDVTVTDLTVTGCVPEPNPNVNDDGDHGSGIRIDAADGVTVRDVIVRDSHGTNAAGLPVGCYGVLATQSRDLLVTSSEIFHNGAGIQVTGGGKGVVVEDNEVHDQDVIVQNSADELDDFGGHGLGATFITDKPGPVFRRNTVLRNFGPSTDYGVDGGGVEIYDSANTTITGNTFSDNDGVMETGSGKGGTCADNVFSDNRVTGRTGSSGPESSPGMVLRCATRMVVKGNSFTDLDAFVFLFAADEPYAGSVTDLRIEGNTVTQPHDTVVYRMQFKSSTTPPMAIDTNRYRAAQKKFAVIDDGTERTVSFEDWRSRTGFDAGSSLF
jgi:hypothetical protein